MQELLKKTTFKQTTYSDFRKALYANTEMLYFQKNNDVTSYTLIINNKRRIVGILVHAGITHKKDINPIKYLVPETDIQISMLLLLSYQFNSKIKNPLNPASKYNARSLKRFTQQVKKIILPSKLLSIKNLLQKKQQQKIIHKNRWTTIRLTA